MSEEQKDLEILKLRQNEIKLEAFEIIQEYLNMDAEALSNCGHKSLGAAIHLKKYPD